MDIGEISKFYRRNIICLCVNVVASIVILSLLVVGAYADLALGIAIINQDLTYFAGVGIAVLYLTFSLLGIVFSILSLTVFKEKSPVRKGFSIVVFVIFIIGTLLMASGAILVVVGLADVVHCIQTETPQWVANCSLDLVYYEVGIACMLVIVGISILGAINSVKIVSFLNKNFPRTTTLASGGAPQPAGLTPVSEQGKFCSSCGSPNELNAKFCKSCGKML